MPLRRLAILLSLLSLKLVALVALIFYGGIGLGPDEAQYWTWSRHLDWGYYSKPPGIAWEIFLGTTLFGNTELGVRALPLAIGFALPLALFFAARRASLSPAAALLGALCFAFSPLGVLASFLAITDGAMVLFWTLGCISLIRAVEKKEEPNPLTLGFWTFCAALFKWPAFALWLLFFIARWLAPVKKSPVRVVVGVALSLCALLPSVYWNATHEWATFRHVFSTLQGGHAVTTSHQGNPLSFLGAQALLISPIFFFLLLVGWGRSFKQYVLNRFSKEDSVNLSSSTAVSRIIPRTLAFCLLSSLLFLGIGVVMACFMKMQGNWIVFAYPIAFLFFGWYATLPKKRKWVFLGLTFSLIAGTVVYTTPMLQSHNIGAAWPIPYKSSPFKHNVGWNHLKAALSRTGYDPTRHFLFGDTYQTVSILSFYGPGQKNAYFLNLEGARKNQFSFWPGMETQEKGKTGFFVAVENIPQLTNGALPDYYGMLLLPYFEKVEFIGIEPLFTAYGEVVKGAFIYKCSGYNGKKPLDTQKY